MTSINNQTTYTTNPFLTGFRVSLRHSRHALKTPNRQGIIDLTTGQITETAEVVKNVPRDAEPFIKLFSEKLSFLFLLSQPAIRVLGALFMEMSRNTRRDSVMLTERTAAAYAASAGVSLPRASYYKGKRELIEHGLIATSSEPNVVWINPAFFFNGDRLPLINLSQPFH